MKGTRLVFRLKDPLKFSMQPPAATCKDLPFSPLGSSGLFVHSDWTCSFIWRSKGITLYGRRPDSK